LRLHRQDHRLGLFHQQPVVARPVDLVRPLEPPHLGVDRVGDPHVLGLESLRGEESPNQRSCHVARSNEANLLHAPSRQERGRRCPKSARPSRTNVAPSSTASEKSSLIPIERWGNSTPRRRATSSRSSRVRRKWFLSVSGTPSAGAI